MGIHNYKINILSAKSAFFSPVLIKETALYGISSYSVLTVSPFFCPVINLYSLLFYTKQSIRIFVHVTDALVWIAIRCGQSCLINIPVWFHNGFISEGLTASSERHAFVILLLLLHLLWDCVSVSSKYIIIPSPRRISVLLRAFSSDMSLLMSWLGKQGWTNAVKCHKCQDPSPESSDAPPTMLLI